MAMPDSTRGGSFPSPTRLPKTLKTVAAPRISTRSRTAPEPSPLSSMPEALRIAWSTGPPTELPRV